jgi:hypothetical protein
MAGTSQDEPGHDAKGASKGASGSGPASTALAIVDSLKCC